MQNDKEDELAAFLVERTMLAEKDRRGNLLGSIHLARIDINKNTNSWTTTDITPEAGKTMMEVAMLTHAVPAQEATKQAQEETKRTQEMTKWETQFTIRHYGVVAAVIVLAILVFLNPNAAVGIGALGAVLGGVYLGTTYIEKKQVSSKKDAKVSQD